MEDSSQSSQHGTSLLLHRRKITADAAKSGDPSGCAGYLDYLFESWRVFLSKQVR